MFRASLIPRTKVWVIATCTAIKTWKTIYLGSGLNLQGNGLLQADGEGESNMQHTLTHLNRWQSLNTIDGVRQELALL
jgi:hypothetical protein